MRTAKPKNVASVNQRETRSDARTPTSIARYIDGLTLRADQINEQVRAIIDHPGEKGRAAEHIVRGLVREILPRKFSIGTGFIVTSRNERSSQLDIVLFDEQLNAPLSLVGDIGVFPIECVYATIEVKSVLNRTTLEQAAQSIGQLRKYKTSKYYTASVLDISSGTISMLPSKEGLAIDLAPRTYIFAFRTSWSLDTLKKELAKAAKEHGAYFHGVVVLSRSWFLYQLQKREGKPTRFITKQGSTVNEFALKLSKDTIRYPMFPANMESYLRVEGEEES